VKPKVIDQINDYTYQRLVNSVCFQIFADVSNFSISTWWFRQHEAARA